MFYKKKKKHSFVKYVNNQFLFVFLRKGKNRNYTHQKRRIETFEWNIVVTH